MTRRMWWTYIVGEAMLLQLEGILDLPAEQKKKKVSPRVLVH